MNWQDKLSANPVLKSLLVRGSLALLVLLVWLLASAKGQSQSESPVASPSLHVTHVLGFEDVRRNASGELSIDNDELTFQRHKTPTAQVSIRSIQNVSLGEQDKQVGGLPMMVGKAAIPYSGGRVVSLVSHKKYDNLTIEYLDSNGGFHGAIFRLGKGQGEAFKNTLIAHGAQISRAEDEAGNNAGTGHGAGISRSENEAVAQNAPQESMEGEKWSAQVDRVDPGDTTVDPCFADAIYENLLRQLSKAKQFKDVFRAGDRNANDALGMLVLKTIVEKYSPGSETRRAVTTVTGATKLKVHIQLVTRDGRVVLDRTVEGKVRFIGDNLKATSKVANNTAKILKRSPLPAADAQPTAIKEGAGTI
jgi:hypothetical protein